MATQIRVPIKKVKQKPYNTDFTHAVRQQDIKTLTRLVEANPSVVNTPVDATSNRPMTPLFIACELGRLPSVKFLIENNASIPDAIGVYGDDNVADYVTSALNVAVINGHKDVVEYLIGKGVDIHNPPPLERNKTPLHEASQYNRLEIVQLLFNNGAIINADVLCGACKNGHVDIVRFLLLHGDAAIVNSETSPPLTCACKKGNIEIVRMLLEKGARVNMPGHRKPPMHEAAQHDHLNVMRLLIDSGANVNTDNYYGDTPLHVASSRGSAEVARLLIENGANVNVSNNDGDTPLHMVTNSHGPKAAITQLLIQSGANVNAINNAGIPILKYAVEKCSSTIVRALFRAGATITADIVAHSRTFLDHGIDYEKIYEFLSSKYVIKASVDPTVKWEGYTKSSLMTFESQLFNGGPDSLSSFSLCPVCLGTVTRSSECNYMHHVCDRSYYVNDKLYNKHKSVEGIIWWCAVCGRICNKHNHYELAAHGAPRPSLNPGGPMYGTKCSPGGGDVEEKIARFRVMLKTYTELQGKINTITRKKALDLVTTRMWDAPLHITDADREIIATIIANKSFGIDSALFSNNSTSAPVVAGPKVGAPPGSFEPPEVFMGENSISFNDNIPVIRFKHKNAHGVMHAHEYVVGVKPSLIDYIKERNSITGYACFEPECGGLLWPEEIEMAFEHELIKPSIADEEKRRLANYKRRFYEAYRPVGGGRRMRKTRRNRKGTRRGRKGTRRSSRN